MSEVLLVPCSPGLHNALVFSRFSNAPHERAIRKLSGRKAPAAHVDDDPLIADTLSFALGHAFEIVTSHSRANCLQLLRQLRRTPELALVDLGLPPHPHRPDEGFALISELLKRSP